MLTRRMSFRRISALAACSLLGAACGSSGSEGSSASAPVIESFTSASSTVFVGEGTELTALFSGDTATIDGLGPVQSGTPVATPALARSTTFTLTVRRGSQQVEAQVTVAAVYRDRFRELASSPEARTQHVAMALADGGALVMGGNSSESINVPDTDTTQRFDPIAEAFSPGPTLAFSAMATFTLPAELQGGGFLLVGGGINSGAELGGIDGIRATQVFDPTTGGFRRVGDLAFRHRLGATATLRDGSVLVSGGETSTAAERYDPSSSLWTSAGDMITGRRGHTATTLGDGRVLLVGGIVCCDATGELVTGTAEIFDPVHGNFLLTGSLGTARAFHSATLLRDGRVLVTGGFVDASTATASTEIYDPSTGLFSPAGAMQVDRTVHSAILLTDGRVLVLGGSSANTATDLYDPAANRWIPGPALQPAWAASTATLLATGKVLVFGGEDAQGFPVSTVMLFE